MADYTVGIKVQMDTSSVEKGTDKTKEKFHETEKAASTFGDTLKAILTSKVISSGINAVVDGLKSIGTAAVNLTKEVIASYGEYEQLTGGVEKLFGDSSKTIIEYSKDAYKNAQMDANTYLETITGFSAALINSLEGDTEKAAEVANMAVQDMADNANVFGTSIEEVRGVYQSLAKGNYQVLDNLKLGYKGSKEGMKELIDHANQLKEANGEMGDLTIDSYADIVEAIHLVQEEMNITGTTQQEASKTIQGSIGSMKSAWKNFVTGLGDDNADIAELADNVISSATDVLDNVMPIIDNIVEAVPTAIESIAQAVEDNNLVGTVIKSAKNIAQSVIRILPGIMKEIAGAAAEIAPELIDGLVEGIGTLALNLDDILSPLIEQTPELVDKIADGIIKLLPSIGKSIGAVTGDIIGELPKIILDSLKNTPDLIVSLVTGIGDSIHETLVHAFDLEDTLTYRLETLTTQVQANKTAWQEVRTALDDAGGTANAQAGNWQTTWEKLQSITDESGYVKDGYHDIAQVLINELNKELGTNITYLDGQIQDYKDLPGLIDKAIEKKRAEMILDAESVAYQEALKQQPDLIKAVAEAEEVRADAQERVNWIQQQVSDGLIDQNGLLSDGTVYIDEYQKAQGELEQADRVLAEAQSTLDDSLAVTTQYMNDYRAATEGNYEAIGEATYKYVGNSRDALRAYGENLQQRITEDKTLYDSYLRNYEQFGDDYDREQAEFYKERYEKEQAELERVNALVNSEGEDFSAAYVNGVLSGKTSIDNAARTVATSAANNVEYIDDIRMPKAGKVAAQQYGNAISSQEYSVSQKAKSVATSAANGLGSQQGSAWDYGYYTGRGFLNGLSNVANSIINKAWGIAQSVGSAIASALHIGSPSKLTEELGEYTGEGFEIGLVKSFKSVLKTVGEYMTDIGDTIGADLGLTMTPPEISYDQSSGQGIYNADNIGSMTGLGNKAITTTTIGDINVYAQPGQDEAQIAQSVADIILGNAAREEVVFA